MDQAGKTIRLPDEEDIDVLGPQWGTARFDDGCQLILRFIKDNCVLTIDVRQATSVIVGRGVEQENTPLSMISLASLNAHHYGVSRQHARIEVGNNVLRITDLDSTNGTRVNGVLLTPNTPTLLRDGDELIFGELKCQAFYTNST